MKTVICIKLLKSIIQRASCLVTCCLLCVGPVATSEAKAEDAKLTTALKSMIGDTGTKVPGLGTIIYVQGKPIYKQFLGSRYINNTNRSKDLPVTEDTRFRVASVSKQFTSYTIMQLAEQGKLSLDGDISSYLGFMLRHPAYPNIPITVRMLMSHTSSLRDGSIYAIAPHLSVKEFFTPQGKYWEAGKHFAPKGEAPGVYFQYSNLNYGLLGTIIEKITGERFDLYQKEHIFKDLDIKADYTVGNLSPQEFEKLGAIYQKNKNGVWQENGPWVAQIDDYHGKQPQADLVYVQNPDHRETDKWYSLQGYQPGTNATIFSPQGGLRISYKELGNTLEFLLHKGKFRGKQVLSSQSLQEVMKVHWQYNKANNNGNTYGGTLENYGLGLFRIVGNSTSRVCQNQDVNLLGHTGEAYGLLSGIFIQPETQSGFIYMMNGEAVAEDDDPRSAGKFSGNYIWEENIMNVLMERILAQSVVTENN